MSDYSRSKVVRLKATLDELKTITTDFGNVEELTNAFAKTSDQVKIIIEI